MKRNLIYALSHPKVNLPTGKFQSLERLRNNEGCWKFCLLTHYFCIRTESGRESARVLFGNQTVFPSFPTVEVPHKFVDHFHAIQSKNIGYRCARYNLHLRKFTTPYIIINIQNIHVSHYNIMLFDDELVCDDLRFPPPHGHWCPQRHLLPLSAPSLCHRQAALCDL